ncbi:MAG: hypothetical protein DRP54_06410 [Spirochaetes bacterium]|nr:MAG: hypothetical protein DRP54_06410 [Spirochaetota bacterium]
MGKIEERKKEIMKMLSVNDFLKIEDLVRNLSVSEATVRRTLVELEKEGKVIRTHGGVKLFYSKPGVYLFNKRASINVKQKTAIGKKAASLINSDEIIFFDSGTTVLKVAEALDQRIKSGQVENITVITNSIAVAEVLGDSCRVILLGGHVRPYRKDVSGPIVEKNIKMFRAHKSFIGTDGITLREGLMTTDEYTSKIDEEMVARGQKVFLVADSSKFNNPSFVSYGSIKDVDLIITDDDLDPEMEKEYRAFGVNIILVKVDEIENH